MWLCGWQHILIAGVAKQQETIPVCDQRHGDPALQWPWARPHGFEGVLRSPWDASDVLEDIAGLAGCPQDTGGHTVRPEPECCRGAGNAL